MKGALPSAARVLCGPTWFLACAWACALTSASCGMAGSAPAAATMGIGQGGQGLSGGPGGAATPAGAEGGASGSGTTSDIGAGGSTVGSSDLGSAVAPGEPAGAIDGVAPDGAVACTATLPLGLTLVGLVRDFKGATEVDGDPDFEAFTGGHPTLGLVLPDLGPDGKPQYASKCEANAALFPDACPYGQQTTSKALFDEWYRDTPGVNLPYLVTFHLADGGGLATFGSESFFPLDGAGWGASGDDENGVPHNFGFTTELHTTFRYQGGEHFAFSGDDDLWVFINGHLAVDLGGSHPSASASVELDTSAATLGIVPGTVYRLDLFHAERHTAGSHFRVDTNFVFVDCGKLSP